MASHRLGTPSGSGSEPQVRMDILAQMRVFDQSHVDPANIALMQPSSRTFRLTAFALHFGLSVLESPQGRSSLVATARDIWSTWSNRQRRGMHFQQGNTAMDATQMNRAVNEFLASVRENPPNIIISTRVTGEGLTQRVHWANRFNRYNAKFAALFRLNRTVYSTDSYDSFPPVTNGLIIYRSSTMQSLPRRLATRPSSKSSCFS